MQVSNKSRRDLTIHMNLATKLLRVFNFPLKAIKKGTLPALPIILSLSPMKLLADVSPATTNVQYQGITYTIGNIGGVWSEVRDSVMSSPWFGSQEAAKYFTEQVEMKIGDYHPDIIHTTFGPAFAWAEDGDGWDDYGWHVSGSFAHDHSGLNRTATTRRNFAYGNVTSVKAESVQPYAAMQTVGLGSMKNHRNIALASAGECNNYGWVVDGTDFCIHSLASNTNSYVNGTSSLGGYKVDSFNSAFNVERHIGHKWKTGISFGVGTSNLGNYNFSGTTSTLSSHSNHYAIYGVKKVSDKFNIKGLIGYSDYDYKGTREDETTIANSSYDTDGYMAEINGIWQLKKYLKNSKTPLRFKPSLGLAFSAHTQDGFSENGTGTLITVESNQSESLIYKTGVSLDKEIEMEEGKWVLVPFLSLNYEYDGYANKNNRGIKSVVTGNPNTTEVIAQSFDEHYGSAKVGADFLLRQDLMFSLNAKYGLSSGGDDFSYGGGFRWCF